MASQTDHIITGKDRTLARLALASGKDTSLPCPDVADLALLIDGRLESEAKREELWLHLASCPVCYEQWRIIAELQSGAVEKRSLAKIISITGGLLAAAASIMLFINIQYSSIPEVVMDESFHSPPHVLEENEVDIDSIEELMLESAAPMEVESGAVERSASQGRRLSKSAPPPQMRKSRAPASRFLQSAPPQSDTASQATNDLDDDPFAALEQEDAAGEILLDINRVIPTVLQRMKQAEVGTVIEVKTYKRDRGFSVEKRGDDQLLIREFGFNEQEIIIPLTKLKKTLKTMLKAEFPRSNKVWLRTFSNE